MAEKPLAPEFAARRRSRWVWGTISLVVLLAIAFSARPAWRALKEWRALQLAEEARQYLADDALELAWERAQTAYQNYPLNDEVARTVAQVYEKGDPGRAVPFWEEAYELSGSKSDLESLILSATTAKSLPIANDSLETYRKRFGEDGAYYFMLAKLRLRETRIEEALAAANSAIQAEEIPEGAHFFYIQLTQFSDNAADRAAGVDYLRALTNDPGPLGLSALRNLGQFPDIDADELREVIVAIRNHPQRERDDLLYALELEMRLPETDAAANYQAAEELFGPGNPEQQVEFGRWLNSQRRYRQTLELIDERTAFRRRDLFLVWLDSLAVTNQWSTIDAAINRPEAPISRELKLLFQARSYFETGQRERAEFAWSRAVLEVAQEPQKLWFLENYARKLGLEAQSREALERLTTMASSRRKAYEKLVQLEQVDGDVRELRRKLQRMAAAYPNDLSVRNDLAYADLLLGDNIEASHQVAQELIDDGSPYLANRITLALALYRMGRPIDALEVLEPLPIDWNEARSGFRAVYVAILRANGRIDEANRLLSQIDPTALLPEERQLLGMSRS